MEIKVSPGVLTRGRTARVYVFYGPPDSKVVVDIDNGGRPTVQTDRVEVTLDAKGNGNAKWLVPEWIWANFHSPGYEGQSRSVIPPASLGTWIWRRLELFARALKFIVGGVGSQYRLGRWRRIKLLLQLRRHRKHVTSLSSFTQHLLLVERILELPKWLEGDVVECGCYDGGSTISLSLACGLAGRRLFVCDSFEGLPKDQERHAFRPDGSTVVWHQGDYASAGELEGVKERVARHGNIDVCQFVKGYFCDTLKDLPTDKVVLIFEDADLVTALKDVLIHLWPKLQPDGEIYCHEPFSYEIVALFYDRAWWRENLGVLPPGFIGSGDGVRKAAGIGYAIKLDPARDKRPRVGAREDSEHDAD